MFSLSLIRDLCLTPGLRGSEISLMDINEQRLDSIHRLTVRYAEEMDAGITATKTTDRRESLAGADFVINTALVPGWEKLRGGWDIARRLSYRWGGSLHVMHDEAFWINYPQLAFFEEVVEDVLDVCPNVWYLQVANPVLAGTTHLTQKYPALKIVGLCHGFSGVYRIADALGLDRDKLTYEIPGVNHTLFATHIYYEGRDVFPLLDRWIEEEAETYWKTARSSDDRSPQAIDLYKRFGVFPNGDICTPGGGSWPWWYHTYAATEARWQEDPEVLWERYFTHGVEGVDEIEAAARDESTPVSTVFPRKHSGEVMVPMIEALATDTAKVLIGNVPNRGEYVPGVPRDFAVEIPLLVTKRGIEPIQAKPLPQAVISHILYDRVATVTLEIEAFKTGSKARLLELVQLDPFTRLLQQAETLLNEILDMPGHEVLKAHYV